MAEKLVITPADLSYGDKNSLIISEADLSHKPEPIYHEAFRFYVGEPRADERFGNMYYVPDVPHLHDAIVEIKHTDGTIERSEGSKRVLVAHGVKDTQGKWTFKDGRQVKLFVDEYNRNNPQNPINIAAVCNPTEDYHKTTTHGVGSAVGVSAYSEGVNNWQTVIRLNLEDPENGYMYQPDSSRRKRLKRSFTRATRLLLNKR